jgi:hypothetical protein
MRRIQPFQWQTVQTKGDDAGKSPPMTAAYQDPNSFEEGSVKFV